MRGIVETTDRRSGLAAAIVIGIVYCAVGVVFQGPFAWRLAAWVLSAAVYAIHLVYEQFGLRHSPRVAAVHVAAAVALGAFGLAVAATLHRTFSAGSPADFRLYALALIAWPVLTALPAFVVGLIIASAIARLRTHAQSQIG